MVKTTVALVAVAALVGSADAMRPGQIASPGLARTAVDTAQRASFDAWAKTHERTYATSSGLLGSSSEYERRLDVYKANLKHAEYLVSTGANKHESGSEWTVSKDGPFMDLTHDEFKATLNYKAKPMGDNSLPTPFKYADTEAADTVDWVSKGAVTPIKNQGQCGSCWAFSTVGGMEGANFVATGTLTSLSEQQLVSCDTKSDQGCNGGLMDNAFQYIIDNGGLDTETDYPYASGGGQVSACDSSKESSHSVTISSFQDVPKNSEDGLRKALTGQPVSVAVDATLWQYYGGGVFHGVFGYCGTQLDHGVLLVAMDGDAKTYTVKNSWGPTWGEKGYIRLPQDKGAEGMCAIAAAASVPVV